MTAATGIRRAKLFSSRTRPWRSCCAANSKPCSPTSAQTWSPPLPPGPSPGSSTSTIGVKVTRPCCAISHDTYSASPSPTRASSLSTTTPSPSATSSANHRAGAPAACTATSSFAGSSSTSCPKACIRSDISAFGTLADASAPLRPAFSSSANAQPRRPPNQRHQAFSKSLTKAPQSPPHRGAVQLAVEATSSTSAGSRPKMPSDHDTLLPLPGSIVLIVRVLEAPQPSSARRPDHLPSRVQQTLNRPFVAQPSSRQNPWPPIIPPLSRPNLDRNRPAAQLKIPCPAEPPGAPHPRQSNRVSASASAAETLNSFCEVSHCESVFPLRPSKYPQMRILFAETRRFTITRTGS